VPIMNHLRLLSNSNRLTTELHSKADDHHLIDTNCPLSLPFYLNVASASWYAHYLHYTNS
jgi:hypothetical protein